MAILVDGTSQSTQNTSILNGTASLPPGTHTLAVQATDSAGTAFQSSISLNVCAVNPASPSVTICTPSANGVYKSPVSILATATNNIPIKVIQLYVDGVKVTQQSGNTLDYAAALAKGKRRLTVQSVDSNNGLAKQTMYITVQ
jgi:hypothetical protein